MKQILLMIAVGALVGCGKEDPAQPAPSDTQANKPEPAKPEPAKPESAKPESAKPEPTKPEPTKPEPTKAKKPGTVLWEFKTGRGVISSPAIGSDGTVYVGSFDYKLYAIKTDSKGLAKSPWPMRGQNARHTGRVMKK